MKIYFVRHGETNYNVANLCNDDSSKEVHLTVRGREQSEFLAEKLKNETIGGIIISELSRTRETAEIINKYHNVPILVDSRINDRKTGFESKSASAFFAAVESAPDKWSVKFNEGESFLEEKERVFSFLDDLPRRGYETMLIITHSEIMKIVYGYFHKLSNEEMWEIKIDNAQILEFTI
ncbi:MAG: histidine phosphatase family protein [Candidatus Wildermuthbacteria bacterium]|nr:histidine phosphatase family protein [Candidatus Wildermuthbacteria bacterium]